MRKIIIKAVIALLVLLCMYACTSCEKTDNSGPSNIDTNIQYALEVMPNSGDFERMDIDSYSLPASIKEVYKAANGGYVFIVEFNGFRQGNVAAIGVDDNGVIVGTKIIKSNDTYGKFEEWDTTGYFDGVNLETINDVDSVSGCTMSYSAYRTVIKSVLEAAKILG